jgi:hypothetical protein
MLKTLTLILLITISSVLFGQTKDTLQPQSLQGVTIESNGIIAPLSVLDLLLNSKNYVNQTIKVEGYLIREFEHSALYFSKEGLGNRMSSQAIWIDWQNSKVIGNNCNNKLVIIYCKFKPGPYGHRGMFRGELYDIEDIIVRKQ